jgi:hypothetical protein
MNRTLKEATVRRYHYDSHDQLPRPSRRFPGDLQLRKAAENPARPHASRIHLQMLDRKTGTVQAQSIPPHAGTQHLAFKWAAGFSLLPLSGSDHFSSAMGFASRKVCTGVLRNTSAPDAACFD